MKRLILHHRYSLGMAWDLSGFDNHGRPDLVWPGSSSLRFIDAGARIDVAPSKSLKELGAFRCCATFQLEPVSEDKRYNLVESQLSFALYLDYGSILRATILDADENWTGAEVPHTLADGQWHRVDCGHDGLRTSWLAIDGRIAAVREDVPGPVRPVGPNGLTIGHWPESEDNGYTFRGSLGEVWLWQSRPDPPVPGCCVDGDALARAEEALRRLGYDRDKLEELRRRLAALAASVYRVVPAEVTRDVDRTAAALANALRNCSWPQFVEAATHARDVLEAHAPEQRRSAGEQLVELLLPLLSERELVESLGGLLCCAPPREPDRRPDERPQPEPFSGEIDPEHPEPGYARGAKPPP